MKDITPTLVTKRDGRREPFDADKISQALFAATEDLGAPNAFLARELTDGVLHFLARENDREVPTTAYLAELIEKIVRELGQSALAHAFRRRCDLAVNQQAPTTSTQESPLFALRRDESADSVRVRCLTAYSLHAMLGRDLAAAHADNLIHVRGLDEPTTLWRSVVDTPTQTHMPGWRAAWNHVRLAPARHIVVDSAESYFEAHGPDWLAALADALEAFDKTATINLNTPSPAWSPASDGLFNTDPTQPSSHFDATRALCRAALGLNSARIRLDWHLRDDNPQQLQCRELLQELLAANCRFGLTLVVDAAPRLVYLAEGIERGCPAVLAEVGLNLPVFLARPEVDNDAERLLAKLPSLVRMAVAVGVQKRAFLRRHAADLGRGFLLDRARLVVTPLGLGRIIHALLHECPARSPQSLELARRIVQILGDQLQLESRAASLECVLDSPGDIASADDGLGCPDERAPLEGQLRAAGALQRVVRRGTARIAGIDRGALSKLDWLGELLTSDVVRLCIR